MRLAGDRGARLLPPSRRAWVHEALPAGAALLAGEAAAVGSQQQQQQRPAAARQPTAVVAAAVCEQMVLYWRRPDGVCSHSVTYQCFLECPIVLAVVGTCGMTPAHQTLRAAGVHHP